jgi:YD repeat-containing protein
MVMPSGARVELRRIGSSSTYESTDSAHLQLIDYGTSLLVRPTDGTQLNFVTVNYTWRCNQIKDRNGNYLSVSYNSWGDTSTITDTLGRVVNFNYDGYDNLTSITQTWNGQTHQWATFGYGSVYIGYNFSGLTSYGPDGSYITVLTQVGLPDGSRYNFEYNNTYGQVSTIRHYAFDGSELGHTTYDLPASTSDCPRVSARRDWAENWSGLNGVPAEAITQYRHDGDGACRMTAPDSTVYKEYYGTGWQKGLTTQSEVWSDGVRQKWTTAQWTQDNTGVNYQTNPRVTETNIYDVAGNRRRTTVDYGSYAQYGLPNGVFEYAADGVTLLRVTYTDYNLSQAYLDRHLIGLVSAVHVSDGAWQSKLVYSYDAAGDQLQAIAAAAIQHDTAYGTGFITGRGNVTAVSRYDVTDIGNDSKALTMRIGYDSDGSVVFTRDALNHQTSLSYADSFSDSNNSRNTFAYPTTATDADGFSSYSQYNYDFGAKTQLQGPPPAGQSQGVIQTFTYDPAARVQQVTTTNTGAYQRYVYGPNYVQSFSSVNNVADDAYAIQVFDGAGRVIGAASNHPGSAGGYRLLNTIYDLMGRAVKQSNPGEINNSWVPVGDDAAGLLYTQQTYDWKGRPLVTTNTDGTQKYASYSACGCAGSEVATLTDEMGRQQKSYSDVLGRTAKTEVLNWDGSVYAAMVNTYNGRDQVTLVRQFQGPDTSGVYQDTTMTYDGYGRVVSKHVPEQNAGTATAYAYNADDTVYSVTDARGASATYSYNNNRRLVTGINYSAPSGVTATPNVTFGYDALGNRTSMSDGFGSKSYAYNQLSQLTSETRTFNGVGTFTLSYQYSLSGELTKITDPTNMSINYGYNSVGRLTGVTGSDSLFANVSNYASNFQYRAWGGVKAMTDGSNHTSSLLYNSKLQPTHFDISGNVVGQNYDYNNDGRVSFVHNTTDANFDRAYSYDHAGRLTQATTGGTARGDSGATPYHETFGYDALSNLTGRESTTWNQDPLFDGSTYTNNRRGDWGYDPDGRNTTIDTRTYTFDAAGQQTLMAGQRWVINHYVATSESSGYDGDGAKVQDATSGVTTYYLRSSLLGSAIIEEINGSGQKNVGYVYAGGQMLARQQGDYIAWKHSTPAGTGQFDYNVGGVFGSGSQQRVEFDPLGADVGLAAPQPPDTGGGEGDIGSRHIGGIMDARWADFFNLDGGCVLDGLTTSCGLAMSALNSGAASEAMRASYYNLTTHQFDYAGYVYADPVFGFAMVDFMGHGAMAQASTNGNGRNGTLPDSYIVNAAGTRDSSITIIAGAEFVSTGPQNTGFNLGRAANFTDDQKKILKSVSDRIKDKDCRDFINKVLADNHVAKDRNTLDKLLGIASANTYNENLTDTQLGVSMDGLIYLRNAFNNDGASAATVGNSMFFVDRAFQRTFSSVLPESWPGNRNMDTATIAVHELLHVAGLNDPQVQNLNRQIHENCGFTGMNY